MRFFFALVWLVNGLYCKVLDQVPRHRHIVGRIMGNDHAHLVTVLIGVSEILMSVWIVSGIWRRFNAWTQIMLVLVMNVIELILVPDLLLFGRLNIVIAVLFSLLIFLDTFVWHPENQVS